MTERATGRLVGSGGLRVHTADHGVALRLAFSPDAQGKGYGPEFGRAALAFAFEVPRLAIELVRCRAWATLRAAAAPRRPRPISRLTRKPDGPKQ